MNSGKTIAAIATPNAAGGIGIIRISGPEALEVADNVFLASNGLLLSRSEGYRAYHGRVVEKGTAVDEAVCLVFRSPKSYTGEDVAEISCHGGLFLLRRVLGIVLKAGAVPAQPGEFTKRAFLNGKIDLTEAEAVMSLISASGASAASAALNALDGALSKRVGELCSRLVAVSAQMAAWVDYPDEEIEELSPENLLSVFQEVRGGLEALLSRFDAGKAISQGVDTAIVGRPNVGKSTLMNLLSGCERSIVTDFAGTTRDVVEETVNVGEVVLRLSDTAGLRRTDDPVESIGVSLAVRRLERAELILAVFDGSDELTDEDRELLMRCSEKRMIAVVNKSDLPQRLDRSFVSAAADRTVEISALTGEGARELEAAISSLLGTEGFDPGAAALATERQRLCCVKAVELILRGEQAIADGVTLDAVNVCCDAAIEALLELTGKNVSETVVNEVFSRFCVGK